MDFPRVSVSPCQGMLHGAQLASSSRPSRSRPHGHVAVLASFTFALTPRVSYLAQAVFLELKALLLFFKPVVTFRGTCFLPCAPIRAPVFSSTILAATILPATFLVRPWAAVLPFWPGLILPWTIFRHTCSLPGKAFIA